MFHLESAEASFLVVECMNDNNLFFTLEGLYQHAPDHQTPKNCNDIVDPRISVIFFCYPWKFMCLTKAISVLTPSCLPGLINMMPSIYSELI